MLPCDSKACDECLICVSELGSKHESSIVCDCSEAEVQRAEDRESELNQRLIDLNRSRRQ